MMENPGSHLAILLHDPKLRETLIADDSRSAWRTLSASASSAASATAAASRRANSALRVRLAIGAALRALATLLEPTSAATAR